MNVTSTLLRSTAAAALAALAVASGASAGGPVFSVGEGCAAQCIRKALVTATASTAHVRVKTTVPANVWVSIEPAAPSGGSVPGGLVLNTTRTVFIPAISPGKIASFSNLDPNTTYAIVVRAVDLDGRKASRSGTFRTRRVKTTGHAAGGGLASGHGCAGQCIQRALFTQQAPAGTIARADFRTAVDARVRMVVSLDQAQQQVVSDQTSPGYGRSWQTQVGGLDYGRTYHVSVRATDRDGRTSIRRGTFRTVSASVLVTIQKVKILDDGDRGIAKGELYFRFRADGEERYSSGHHKLGSGAVFTPSMRGTSRPGILFRFPANGDAKAEVSVAVEECDGYVFMKNCVVETNPNGQWAMAGGTFDVSDLLSPALPGWYGTGVAEPVGHDGYFVFGTTDTSVKFLVLATIDLDVEWP